MTFTLKHKFLSSCIVARDCIVKTVSSSRFPSKPDIFSQASSLAINCDEYKHSWSNLTGCSTEQNHLQVNSFHYTNWKVGGGMEGRKAEKKERGRGVTTDQTDPQVHLLWTSTTFIYILWLVFFTVIHPTQRPSRLTSRLR